MLLFFTVLDHRREALPIWNVQLASSEQRQTTNSSQEGDQELTSTRRL
jgi:hypothetical protein